VTRSLIAAVLFVASVGASQQFDVKGTDPDGTTALHRAVHSEDLKQVQTLIRGGANVKASNRYGVTPLWLACVNGNVAIIEALLKAGADPNTATPEGETVLMTAARTGKVDAVKALIVRGANVNAKEGWRGQTALMWAASEGHPPVIQMLIKSGADIHARSNGGFTALLFAARDGQLAAARTLLDAGASLNDSLPARRRTNNSTAPAEEPPGGLNAFLLAAGSAHYELAAFLLDRGSDPNAAPQGWTALHQVSWVRKAGIAGSNNPAPEGSGNLSSLDFVKKLAAKGADLNARVTRRPPAGITSLNFIGGTPFLLAARTADFELMRLFAELGADPLQPNEDKSSPLMVAAGIGTSSPGEDPGTEPEVLEAVKLALALGNDINAVDQNGETAMHGAAYKHVPSVAQFLVEKGARIEIWNQANKKGYTPLRIAQGIQRGMNVVSHAPTAAMLRQLESSAARSEISR
jgi:ankyrin repeat protein